MGQLADKAYGVGDHHIQRIADGEQPCGGVQRIKQPVVGGDTRPGDGVEQGGFSSIGVAHDGHHRDLVFLPPLALGAADPPHLLQLRLQLVDLPVDVAAVRLQLRLTGALGANGTLAAGAGLSLQMSPHTHQPRQQILVLGQLHLQAALLGLGPLGKDVQDQAAAVQHLYSGHLRQHPDLGGREVVVEDDHGGLFLLHHAPYLLHLALSDEAVGIRLLPALQNGADGLPSGGLYQSRQLRQTLLVCVILPQHRGAQPHQHRIVSLIFPVFFQSSAFHIHPRFRFSPNNIVYPAAKVKDPQPKSCESCKKCLYLSRPKRLLNFATRPPVSTSFCLPVKKG